LRYGAAAAVAVLAVVLAFGIWGGAFLGPGGSSASPSPTSSPRPLPSDGPLDGGTYLYDRSQLSPVAFTLTVPDGWFVDNGGWNMGKAGVPEAQGVGFAVAIVHKVNADTCIGTHGQQVDAGSTVDELVNALLDQTGPAVAVEGPFAITLGGYSGQRVDVTAPPPDEFTGCMVPGLQLWYDAGNWFVVVADFQSSIYIVDVAGERVVLATQYQESSPYLAELDAVIGSIEFKP